MNTKDKKKRKKLKKVQVHQHLCSSYVENKKKVGVGASLLLEITDIPKSGSVEFSMDL